MCKAGWIEAGSWIIIGELELDLMSLVAGKPLTNHPMDSPPPKNSKVWTTVLGNIELNYVVGTRFAAGTLLSHCCRLLWHVRYIAQLFVPVSTSCLQLHGCPTAVAFRTGFNWTTIIHIRGILDEILDFGWVGEEFDAWPSVYRLSVS